MWSGGEPPPNRFPQPKLSRTLPRVHLPPRASIGAIWWIASIVAIVWCDVAFVIDAVKTSRGRTVPEKRSPGVGDWIVWVTALLFSVYSFWGIPFIVRAYEHGFDRLDIVLTALALVLIATSFDVALVIDAVKTRTGRLGATSCL